MKAGIWIALAILIVSGIASAEISVSSGAAAQHESPREGSDRHGHGSVAVPPQYAGAKAPPGLWTDAGIIARGKQIHAEKCATCHGDRGDGQVPAAAAMSLKPPDFTDSRMVAGMTDAYWFWRVSEGGAVVEPFVARGSVMPAFKDHLSVEDRWAVIAYQHTQSGHTRPHILAEHPEMQPRGPAMGGHDVAQQHAAGGTSQQVIVLPEVPVSRWVTRDHRWQPRGPWNWAIPRELPRLYREFNGIDFGHSHLAETLLSTQDPPRVEKARLEILDFIFSSPTVPPDEEQVAPRFTRMVWEANRAFNWAHTFHRSLYDLFAADNVPDKEAMYRKLLANYLAKPEAITSHRLDHHGKLWSFPESRAFRDKFRTFNTQIWAYHWLQAATYDVQLLGPAARQRELMAKIIEHYHGYLRRPPVEWQYMPMLPEGAPEFTKRFPEAAAIFDNLHMLHDNIDDVLSRPDLYPTADARRAAILRILPIYLHRNHAPQDRYEAYHGMTMMDRKGGQATPAHGQGQQGHQMMMDMGPRPPSAGDVLEGRTSPQPRTGAPAGEQPGGGHDKH
ncbi:MAG TPA: cytochrome c [Methylomirabilota bacterium]|jgi:mono/diheme cytochrome c family protein|nr:cytochrome c [Methylomirabilota bacterium]